MNNTVSITNCLTNCYKDTKICKIHQDILEGITKLLHVNKSSIIVNNEVKCVINDDTQKLIYTELTIKACNNSHKEDADLLGKIISLVKEAFLNFRTKVEINASFTSNKDVLISITNFLFDVNNLLTTYNLTDIYTGFIKISK